MVLGYRAVYERGPRSWGAYVPRLPGCVAAGATKEDVQRLIQEAIPLHLELLREQERERGPVPRRKPAAKTSPARRRTSTTQRNLDD